MRTHSYFDGLPERAYVTNTIHAQGPDGEPPLLLVVRGEPGYHPIYLRATADDLNKALGVTPPQREALFAGSMFGWHVPAADPRRYDAEGKLL